MICPEFITGAMVDQGPEVREVLAPLWDEVRGRPLNDESRSSLC